MAGNNSKSRSNLKDEFEYRKIARDNRIDSERQIAIFRLIVVAANLGLVFFIMSGHHFLFTVSDSLNLVTLCAALLYTFVLWMFLENRNYGRWMAFASSTVDVALITLAIWATRYSPDGSVASIAVSGAFAVYLPIIIFSVRRHDPANALYTGLLAGGAYFLLIRLMQTEGGIGPLYIAGDTLFIRTDLSNEIVKSVMLGAGGLVGWITARSFDRVFSQGVLREKEVQAARRSLSQYVSREVVEDILRGRISTHGEKREVSILYVDIQDFTAITAKMPPDTMLCFLNAFFDYVIHIVVENGGFVDKFVGDSAMAVFGAPEDLPEHREKAIESALAICQNRSVLAEALKEAAGYEIDMRFGIGVNSGPAIVGNSGSSEKMGYTAIGDTVKAAIKFQAACSLLKTSLVIGDETYNPSYSNLFHPAVKIKISPKLPAVSVYPLKA